MSANTLSHFSPDERSVMVTIASAKSDLINLRNRYLRELAEMAKDRSAGLQKLEDIQNLERALSVVEPASANPLKYGGFKRAIDAILDYLDEQGAPVEESELVRTVTERGFRAPNPAARAIVLKSIAAYLYGEAGRKKQVIKKIGSKIGRGEWEDERFI